ncbi:MAG: FMN-binding negative transcriptional regulator [Caulobacteraceae bacterium]
MPQPSLAMSAPAATAQEIARLILENPLAWIVSGEAAGARATPLPLRPRIAADGRIDALVGHFARSNPQVADLEREPRATILFLGPHAYISPSWLADRTQAPTWNYAAAKFSVALEWITGEAGLRALLGDLVAAVEKGRENPWRVEEMGERYDRLAGRIVGFVARVIAVEVKLKLGQDDRDDVFADASAALAREAREDVLDWMARARPR